MTDYSYFKIPGLIEKQKIPDNFEYLNDFSNLLNEATRYCENLNRLYKHWFHSNEKICDENFLENIYLNNLVSPDARTWVKFTLSHVIVSAENALQNLNKLYTNKEFAKLREEMFFIKQVTKELPAYLKYAARVIASHNMNVPLEADEAREVTRDLICTIYNAKQS